MRRLGRREKSIQGLFRVIPADHDQSVMANDQVSGTSARTELSEALGICPMSRVKHGVTVAGARVVAATFLPPRGRAASCVRTASTPIARPAIRTCEKP